MTTRSSLRFGILGPLQVELDGRHVELGAPKQRAVLAALLVSANRVVSLDRLIDQLWGEDPPPAATSSLQAYVANLRRVLEPDRAPRTPPAVLVTRSPGYVLQVGEGELDAARFAALVDRARESLSAADPGGAHELLGQASGLWRGPALQELAAYDFACAEITRLEELRVAAREADADAVLALGRPGEAISRLEDLVGEHPWRERPRELLMLALYRAGRQAEALALMTRTRAEFAEGLGIDPGPGLQRLHAAILRQDPKLAWEPSISPPAPRKVMPVDPQPLPENPPCAGPVGRAKQLAVLRGALDQVTAGRGRLVLVAGEPGIGKTRLMQELATDAETRGIDVVWGRCHDADSVPAFWPWVQALRTLAGSRSREEIERAAEAGGPWLARLLPELVTAGPSAPPIPLDHARLLLYDAAARMVRELAAGRPLLILVEDLHWADVPSLELLGYLTTQLSDIRAVVVGSYREEATADDPLTAMLATVAREPTTERLRLVGLTPREVAEMVHRRAGKAVDERAAAALHERTDGNPFFVTELTRLLDAEGRLHDPATWPIPDSVRDVLRRRIGRLPEQSVALLSIAAVVGRSFDVDVLISITGLDEDRALDAIEAALITGLLVEDPEPAGRYRFTHALAHETLYDGLSGMRRARLHARIGQALEELHGHAESVRPVRLASVPRRRSSRSGGASSLPSLPRRKVPVCVPSASTIRPAR
jgi:DNA-binding SARP family transcriptional activator